MHIVILTIVIVIKFKDVRLFFGATLSFACVLTPFQSWNVGKVQARILASSATTPSVHLKPPLIQALKEQR